MCKAYIPTGPAILAHIPSFFLLSLIGFTQFSRVFLGDVAHHLAEQELGK